MKKTKKALKNIPCTRCGNGIVIDGHCNNCDTPELRVALAEVALRAAARDYAEVADLENTDKENRKAWVALSIAAGVYVQAVKEA